MTSSQSQQRKNILWVVPVFQSVYPKPFQQFIQQAVAAGGERDRYSLSVMVPERELLHAAMNRAAQTLLQNNFDAMIVSDDDCLPPPDAIPRLLRHFEAGYDVMGGVGFTRGAPHTTTVGRYFEEGIMLTSDPVSGEPQLCGFEWIDDLTQEPADIIKADFCGFPIVIISRRVFERIDPPWFGTWLDGGGCTHDVYFGTKVKRAGLSIHVDRTIQCGHLGASPVITFENRQLVRAVDRRYREEVAKMRASGVKI